MDLTALAMEEPPHLLGLGLGRRRAVLDVGQLDVAVLELGLGSWIVTFPAGPCFASFSLM
jgi:hypothetical protein